MRKIAVFAICLTACPALWAATDVVALSYRSASELEPILQGLIGADGKVASYGNQLIISADNPAKLAELKQLISQLDSEPRRLLITVDSSGSGRAYNQDYSAKGSVELGNSRVEIGSGDKNRLMQGSTTTNQQGYQQFQTLEGATISVNSGMQRPQVTEVYRDPNGHIVERRSNYSYDQGLRITANVQGQQVTLSVDGNYLSPTSTANNIQNNSLSTQLVGRLGQWFDLGSITTQTRSNDQEWNRYQQNSDQSSIGIRVKVDVLQP